MRKRVLILGGKGFLGEHLVQKLSSLDKYDIVVADKQVLQEEVNDKITFLPLDFSVTTNFSKYLKDVDIVVHLVCTIFPDEETDTIEQTITDNTFATLALLRAMVRQKCKKIVFMSSGGTVYGNHDATPISEKEGGFPISNYGIIKDMIEKYISLFGHFYNIDYRIIRLSNPYTSERFVGRKQGLIPILIEKIQTGDSIQIWGDGKNVRDYIHIDDAIQAIIKIIEYAGKEKVFNVGTGVGYTTNDIIKMLCSYMNVGCPKIEYVVSRKCDVDNNILDISLLQNVIKFKPKYSLEEGIAEILNNSNK